MRSYCVTLICLAFVFMPCTLFGQTQSKPALSSDKIVSEAIAEVGSSQPAIMADWFLSSLSTGDALPEIFVNFCHKFEAGDEGNHAECLIAAKAMNTALATAVDENSPLLPERSLKTWEQMACKGKCYWDFFLKVQRFVADVNNRIVKCCKAPGRLDPDSGPQPDFGITLHRCVFPADTQPEIRQRFDRCMEMNFFDLSLSPPLTNIFDQFRRRLDKAREELRACLAKCRVASAK